MREFFEAIHAYPLTAFLVSAYGLIAMHAVGSVLSNVVVAAITANYHVRHGSKSPNTELEKAKP